MSTPEVVTSTGSFSIQRDVSLTHEPLPAWSWMSLSARSNFFARFSQRMAMGVQFQIADPEDNPFREMRAEPARDRPQPREEFPDAEGLRNIIVRTGLQRVYFVLLPVADSDHHYSRERKNGTKTAASLDPTHPRHLNIEQ